MILAVVIKKLSWGKSVPFLKCVLLPLKAEEDYNQAKNAYLHLHSDLYEELPALYDRYTWEGPFVILFLGIMTACYLFFICSRISIYVSSFQSIFTAEGVFHRETAKVSLFHYSILYDSVLF